jgi:hypothetical protein
MSDRAQLSLILACVVGAVAFVGIQVFRSTSARSYKADTAFAERSRLGEFASNGVHVAVFLESDPQGQPLIRATFTPDASGFHLYSKDLNPKRTGGVGVPTRLELRADSSVRVAGNLFADTVPHQTKALDGSVDIYPDGPVSLRLPIQFVGAAINIAAQVEVSYMACSTDGVCLRPIEHQLLDVQIPSK